MKTGRLRICALIGLALAASLLVQACSIDETDVTTTSQTLPTITATPTAAPTPTTRPTIKPEPTAVPLPPSVFIPREELPDGQLFEKEYYAVLEGEGAYYNVYDCFGRIVETFKFTDGESNGVSGLFTELELSNYVRIGQHDVRLVEPSGGETSFSELCSHANGYYQTGRDGSTCSVILYDTAGKHIRTITYKSEESGGYTGFDVSDAGKDTVVCFFDSSSSNEEFSVVVYFISQLGEIVNTCQLLHSRDNPTGLIGRKYFALGWSYIRIVDENGDTVLDGVTDVQANDAWISINEAAWLVIGEYFVKDDLIYNSDIKPVEPGTTRPDGTMIAGVTYDVQGISCKAEIYWQEWSRTQEIVAVGTRDGKIAIKSMTGEYVLDSDDLKYYGMNKTMLILSNEEGTYKQLRSLRTGEVLREFKKNEYVTLSETYALVVDHVSGYSYIIDQDGNTRYVTSSSQIQVTAGEYIILRRGPYIGIADLNGEWIIKTLSREMKRDAG